MRYYLAIFALLFGCANPEVIIVEGKVGATGAPGLDGKDGKDGVDGVDGQDGADAVLPPYAVVAIIDPCGPQGTYDEVLLKLANGQVLASFSQNGSALTTRFVLIPPGTYQTTDGTGCVFSVAADGGVTW